jgi:aspartate/methionine/tyrosine aminotransferase
MRLASRTQAIAPFFAMELSKQAQALAAGGADVIKLNIGEPDFTAAPDVVAAMQAALAGQKTQYTAALGIAPLREAIAQHYWQVYGIRVPARRIVVTAGGSAALLLACAALVEPGDEVLMADPCYPCNRHFVGTYGGTTKLIATDATSRYQLSAQSVAAHWGERSRGVLLASPANPTGTALSPAELAALCAVVKAKGGYRIVDEIYLGLSYPAEGGTLHPQASAQANARHSVLSFDDGAVVVQSFSKYFNMTGWRLGWMVVPDAMLGAVEALAQHLFICPSALAQHAALGCFTADSLALYEQRRAAFQARRDYLVPALRGLGFGVPVMPDGAFYVYADISALARFGTAVADGVNLAGGAGKTGFNDSSAFAQQLLMQAHVAVTPGLDFGIAAPQQHVRFSYANDLTQLKLAVERIGRWLK